MRFEETRQHLVGNSLIQSAMSPLKDANFWSRPAWMLPFFACNKFRLGYNSQEIQKQSYCSTICFRAKVRSQSCNSSANLRKDKPESEVKGAASTLRTKSFFGELEQEIALILPRSWICACDVNHESDFALQI